MDYERREFLKKASLATAAIGLGHSVNAMPASSYNNIIGANERINLAIQGLGRRYGAYIDGIAAPESNARIAYLCDVMPGQMDKAAQAVATKIDYEPKLEEDIRKIFNYKDVDAIFMSTPDHWHTPGAILGMQAGKHIYLEKPCSHNPWENQLVVEAQKNYNKVVQMGNQQRSSPQSIKIINDIHNGVIGKAYKAIAFYANGRGEVPLPVKATPPGGLNWDLFQGPSPRKDYMHDTWDYNWHWYGWDFGTAEMGNNATHELDVARWALGVGYPRNVDVKAGKNHFKDDGWGMYDEMLATYRFGDDKVIQWDGVSRNGYQKYGRGRGTLIMGTEGSVMLDREGYELYDRAGKKIDEMKGYTEGGIGLGGGGALSTAHTINFLNAIRGMEALTSPIDIGAKSQMLTHYANISYRIDSGFDVNEQTGEIRNMDAMKLWKRTYEPGWEPKI